MKLGIDLFNENFHMFAGKRIGLITNPTGLDSAYQTSIDVIAKRANLVALFSPEHGVRGNIQAGDKVPSYVDELTNIIVYSLYDGITKPTDDMMKEIDLLCIDIQDVGSRFYTYVSTMAYGMIACKEHNKTFVVFDRPNPINGVDVEGNILDLKYRSFIGYFPFVQRHGMTIGELAWLFNDEYKIGCDLKIIPMHGYKREMYYEDTKLLWVAPSPNLPTPTSAIVYNATCIFEGTNISEGRGTTIPFEIVGSPFVNPYDYAQKLNEFNFPGVYFRPLYFTPIMSKFVNQMCGGVQLHITNRHLFTPVKVGWTMLEVIRTMYPNEFSVNEPYKGSENQMLDLNTGCCYIKERTYSLAEQLEIIDRDTKEFIKTRAKYLLYERNVYEKY